MGQILADGSGAPRTISRSAPSWTCTNRANSSARRYARVVERRRRRPPSTWSWTSPSPRERRASAQWCARHGVALVIGTTGLVGRAAPRGRGGQRRKVGVVMASNFSVGAVLSEKLRRDGRAVLRPRGDHRTAPRQEGRRAVGHLDRRRRRASPRRARRRVSTASIDPTDAPHASKVRGAPTRGDGDQDAFGALARASSRTRRSSSADRARVSPSATIPSID